MHAPLFELPAVPRDPAFPGADLGAFPATTPDHPRRVAPFPGHPPSLLEV